jgi:hypothetical protein
MEAELSPSYPHDAAVSAATGFLAFIQCIYGGVAASDALPQEGGRK